MDSSATHERSRSRLSIAYLLCLTAGVGVAIAVARVVELLRFPADQFFYQQESLGDLDTPALLAAALYGVCVTTFLFAVGRGEFWSSPGKVLAMLFAVMCIVDWALQAVASVVVMVRLDYGSPQVMLAQGGYVLGIWYRQFAPALGYAFSLPLLLVVVWKTKPQPFAWRLVWCGFLVFALLILAYIFLAAGRKLPDFAAFWYFEAAIGIPVVLIGFALLDTLIRGDRPDWWTALVSLSLVSGWVLMVVLKAFTLR